MDFQIPYSGREDRLGPPPIQSILRTEPVLPTIEAMRFENPLNLTADSPICPGGTTSDLSRRNRVKTEALINKTSPGASPEVFQGSGRSPSAHCLNYWVGARRSPATKVSCEATDTSGSATIVFAFQATPVMSSEVFTRRE
jgi:hypothetical protein